MAPPPVAAANTSTENQNLWKIKSVSHEAKIEELKRNKEEYVRRKSQDEDVESSQEDSDSSAANWPMFYPILHHQLSPETAHSEDAHATSLLSYRLWISSNVLFGANLVFSVVYFVLGRGNGGLLHSLYALILAVLAPFLSFFTAHYPVYLGSREPLRKLLLGLGALGTALQLIPWILMVVGFVDGGAGGVLELLSFIRLKLWYLVIPLAILLSSFSLQILLCLRLLSKIVLLLRHKESSLPAPAPNPASAIRSMAMKSLLK